MLKIKNEEHFHKVLKEVESLDKETGGKFGLEEKLLEQLQWLHGYGDDEDWTVELGYDWANLSFSVAWFYKGQFAFNGGLIFHNGQGMDDGTLSVELNPSQGPHWSIHT